MNDTRKMINKFNIRKDFNLISMPSITLEPEEADQFLNYLEDESVMKDFARIERMTLPQKNIRAIGFGAGRFLYPGDQFNESKYKKQWVQNRIQLSTQKARGAIVIFDDDLEDIRGVESEDAYKDGLMRIIAKKIANELEEVCWMANTGIVPNNFAADDLRGVLDGWRFQINNSQLGQTYYNAAVPGGSYIMNACDGGSSGSDFDLAGKIAEQDVAAPYNWEFKYHAMIKNMPSRYKANNGLRNMALINSDLVTMDYLEALSARATALGDAIFQGQALISYLNVPIIDAPLMPVDLGTAAQYGTIGAGAYADVLFTPKNNLVVGVQREIRMETQRVPADEATYLFYSIRFDAKIENTNAIVFMRCLEHAC